MDEDLDFYFSLIFGICMNHAGTCWHNAGTLTTYLYLLSLRNRIYKLIKVCIL